MKKELIQKLNTLTKEQKKQLKEINKTLKLSDSEVDDLLSSTESDSDDESEEQTDSEKSDKAEETPAKEESKKGMTMEDLKKIISDEVTNAMKGKPNTNDKPKPSQKKVEGGLYIEGYGMIPMESKKW